MGRVTTTPVRRRSAAATIALAGVVLATAACTTAEPKAQPTASPSATASPSPTVDAAEAQARQQALETYDAFTKAYVDAARASNPNDAEIRKYLGEPLRGQVIHSLSIFKQNGIVMRGEPRWNATVTGVKLADSPPVADIEDCVDNTNWTPVIAKTGQPAKVVEKPKKLKVVARLKLVSGRWYVYESDTAGSTPC